MWTIALILAIMWVFGMLTANTMGGLLHILLIVAIIAVVINLFRGGRRAID